jgi:plastocyanin
MRGAMVFVAIATLALAACGADEAPAAEGSGSGDAGLVVAVDGLELDEDEYVSPAGEIAIEYVNDGSLPHTLLVEGVDGFELRVGDTDSGSVELEPGSYTLFCDLPGHRESGMEATLTVQ